MIHVNYLISCTALPLSLQSEIILTTTTTTSTTTSKPIEMDKPVVFSHDENPFDVSSFSFEFGKNLNISQPNPNSIHDIPIVKHHHVLPLSHSSARNARQKRLHVFRPLFVYRQEQAMRRRATARPPIDPDRFYHYPYYPYYYHDHHHQYADEYPGSYDTHPIKSYDYVSNDLLHDKIHAYDYWY